jgi:hypothetical protein
MPQITLDEIRVRIEVKYEPVRIPLPSGGTAELTLPLRLDKDRRAALRNLMRSNATATEVAQAARKARADENAARVAAGEVVDEAAEEDADTAADEQQTREYLAGILRIACTSDTAAEELIGQIYAGPNGAGADGLLVLVELVRQYLESTDAGEVSPSAS